MGSYPNEALLTFGEATRLLRYDETTGHFYWKIRQAACIYVGDKAGTVENNGYVRIRIHGKKYQGHRLAWLFKTGAWPQFEVDHKHGVRHDNRFKMLRKCLGSAEQSQNRKRMSTNKTGHTNVTGTEYGWRVCITVNGNTYRKRFPADAFDAAVRHAKLMKSKMHKFQPTYRES